MCGHHSISQAERAQHGNNIVSNIHTYKWQQAPHLNIQNIRDWNVYNRVTIIFKPIMQPRWVNRKKQGVGAHIQRYRRQGHIAINLVFFRNFIICACRWLHLFKRIRCDHWTLASNNQGRKLMYKQSVSFSSSLPTGMFFTLCMSNMYRKSSWLIMPSLSRSAACHTRHQKVAM